MIKYLRRWKKDESLTRLKEDSLDDIIRPEIKKRYIWPLYEDSAYEISEIIEKYQNTNRFKNEIKSFDLKDISYMDWPALRLEIECSNEAYVLIRKDIEREGLYMDDEFDESLKLKESGMKESYWKYRLDHPFIDRIENSETAIFTDDNIRNIPLLSCENPDDCYSDNPLYWAVEDANYNGNPLYCTEDKAYKRLKDYLNMKIYERRHDL